MLPKSWSGSWFESGERDTILIAGRNMSHKGDCVEKLSTSRYIFKDTEDGPCHRCLSIHQKHDNVLQYKESKCIPPGTRKKSRDICHSISVDEPLKSLFRLTSQPEECPIRGSYSFSYSRGHGECRYPLSSLSQCSSDRSRLVFRYQACADIKGSQSGEERAECVAGAASVHTRVARRPASV